MEFGSLFVCYQPVTGWMKSPILTLLVQFNAILKYIKILQLFLSLERKDIAHFITGAANAV